jgi:CheY-like chemotaxis protein
VGSTTNTSGEQREPITNKWKAQYRILTAPDAEEAMRVSTSYAGPIHLLLTDVVMPGPSGRELARHLRLQRPEMKVLYMTAFALVTGQEQFSEASGDEPDAPVILKPFTSERLTEKVREVLVTSPPLRSTDGPIPGGMCRPPTHPYLAARVVIAAAGGGIGLSQPLTNSQPKSSLDPLF